MNTKRRRRQRRAWWHHVPRHVWVLVEVLVTILVLHYTHVSANELLPLFKLLA